jgi:hypothetical protein
VIFTASDFSPRVSDHSGTLRRSRGRAPSRKLGKNYVATCENATNIIPRISRDQRQTLALGGLRLHVQRS